MARSRPAKRSSPAQRAPASRAWTGPVALVALLVLHVVASALRHDPASFGYFHDDTLYFASARALAAGQGHIWPSIPETPPQTKFPPLYPLLLAGVWKLDPQFPGNLSLALWLGTLFGALLLAAWWVLLRGLEAGPFESLILAGIAAFHPLVMWIGGALLSDIPFMVFATLAAVAARPERRWSWAAAGACAAAAALTRSIGVTVITGILVWALYRRLFRWGAAFLAASAPPVIAGLVWSTSRQTAPQGLPGFQQTMLFHTSYLGFWKFSIPDTGAFAAMLKGNVLEILQAPAALALPLPSFSGSTYLMLLVSLAIWAGLWMLAREGRQPVHFILVFYTAVVMVWNYPLANRFLTMFLPVFLLAGLRVSRRLFARARTIRLGAPVTILAGAALLLPAAYAYLWGLPAALETGSSQRRFLATEKQEAWQWISSHTAPADRFISYEDVSLFLHTGRQALRPIAFSSEANYRDTAAIVERDLQKVTHTARQIHAQYWLASPDDFQLEAGAFTIQQRVDQLLHHFPVVFQSRGGRVRLYRIAAE